MQNFEYGIINDNKNFDLVSTELTDVEKNIVKGFIEREGVINLKNIPNKLGFIGHTKKISGIEMWCVFVKPPNVRGYKGCLIDEQSYEKILNSIHTELQLNYGKILFHKKTQ